jgi:hypothetical protein
MREARLCSREGITITFFCCPTGDRQARTWISHIVWRTARRAGSSHRRPRLDRYVVWDYVKRRRFILG